MAIEKTPIRFIENGEPVSPSVTNRPLNDIETNIDDIIEHVNTLGLGTAAKRDVTTGVDDLTAGRLATIEQVRRYIGAPNAIYTQRVVLLHPVYNGGSLLPLHIVDGTISAFRGSTSSLNIAEKVYVVSSSSYDNNNIRVFSVGIGPSSTWEPVTCLYGGTKYIALKMPYFAPGYNSGVYFEGRTYSQSSDPNILKIVDYYDEQTKTVLNVEIYNSITPTPAADYFRIGNSIAYHTGNITKLISDANLVRSSDLGTAATRDVTTSSTDTTAGRVLKVGDGGWLGRSSSNSYISGYPASLAQNVSQIYRRDANDGPVTPYVASIHFAAGDTWGRLRIAYGASRAWIQGGLASNGSGWTEELYHTGNIDKIISDGNLVQTSRTISAGTGLTGGGNLSANRTISIDPTYDASLVKTSRTISTGTGLTGGGNLSANRTISLANSHIPIGVGQTWQNVRGQRALSTTYTNTTGRPIIVAVGDEYGYSSGATGYSLLVDGLYIGYSSGRGGEDDSHGTYVSGLVPPGSTYRVTSRRSGFDWWKELR